METDDVSKLAASGSWRATAMVGENVVDKFHYVNYRVSIHTMPYWDDTRCHLILAQEPLRSEPIVHAI